ncbi:MAG: purine-nucleoside phosphorylase [Synergistaceae bacterium]|nr:purine-nucleoside phosphorylase [Synergistaceae bacterium]
MNYADKVRKARNYLQKRISSAPEYMLVLGSGLGGVADMLEAETVVSYESIPYWPKSTAPGHRGRLLFGMLGGKYIVVMQGRIHGYEGCDMTEVTFPVRVLGELGVKSALFTNASGGIPSEGRDIRPGSIIAVTDHINFMGDNPLRGANNPEWGDRFPDMTFTYDKAYINLLTRLASEQKIELFQGVYIAMCGPSYETPAEIRMAKLLGADAVGMSTVPEVIAARHMGMRIAVLSCVSNYAAGVRNERLTEDEVLETIGGNADKIGRLVAEFFKEI